MNHARAAIAGATLVATFAIIEGCTFGPSSHRTAATADPSPSVVTREHSPKAQASPGNAAQRPSFLVYGERGVTIGVKADQPQTSIMSGSNFSGFDVDLANYLMSHTTQTKPDFVPVVTADRDQELHDGQLDMVIATYSDTPEREKLVELAGPYMRTDEGILILRSTRDINTLTDLKTKAVCTTAGSTTMASASPLTLPGSVGSLVTKDDISECVDLLREGDVQAVASDLLILYGYQETSNDLTVTPKIDIPESNEWMIGLQPGDKSDCKRVLNVLGSFLKSQWANEFEQWFPDVVRADPAWDTDYRPDLAEEPLRCT